MQEVVKERGEEKKELEKFIEIPAEMFIYNKEGKIIAGERHMSIKFSVEDLKEVIRICQK